MEECRAPKCGDGGPDIGGREDVDSKDICNRPFQVVSIESRDEHFPLLIENEDSRNHPVVAFPAPLWMTDLKTRGELDVSSLAREPKPSRILIRQ